MRRRHLLAHAALAPLAARPWEALGLGHAARAAEAATKKDPSFKLEEVLGGFAHPWGMAFLPEGGILVTERPGRLNLVRDGAAQVIQGTPAVVASGQGGLLDVALHPDFSRNRRVYLSYAGAYGGGYGTCIAQGRLSGERLEETRVIFRMNRPSRATHHFGSRLVFGRDRRLFFGIGDRGQMQRAQDLADHAGKILRITDEGAIPDDNPFVRQEGVAPEIFAYGVRNPQGMALHPETGDLWEQEHGPRGGDEVNVIVPGANYGWPRTTHGKNYSGTVISENKHAPGITDPLHVWVPSIAPSGMAFCTSRVIPAWQGDLFVGALKDRMLVRLRFDGDRVIGEERLLEGRIGRIRDVREGPDGHLWLLNDEDPGSLYRIAAS